MTDAPARERRVESRKSCAFGVDIVQVNDVSLKRKWADEIGINISEQGFCCCSYHPFPEGSTVRCLILFPPPHDERIIEGEAQLVWQRSSPGEKETTWLHGMRFTHLTPSDRHLLTRLLGKF